MAALGDGRSSKRGDPYLRTSLAQGALATLFWPLRRDGPGVPKPKARIAVRSVNQIAVAMANRNAWITWLTVRQDTPDPRGLIAGTAA